LNVSEYRTLHNAPESHVHPPPEPVLQDWGESGYIYLEMDTNTCGLADKPAMVYL